MGILNVTPDSFSDGGQYVDVDAALRHATGMVQAGADIIDVGGESTRPGATPVSMEEELRRVIPVIKRLREVIDVAISIDTYKAEVAKEAIKAGATMINDIWGGKFDPDMPRIMAESNVQVILMHNRLPEQENDFLCNIIEEVCSELQESVDLVLSAGVKREHLILDPGIGFGKTLKQNIEIVKKIHQLKTLGYPVMLAASKKRTIRALTERDDSLSLAIGTVATTCHAYNNSVDYIRVHDVKENKVAITVMKNLNSYTRSETSDLSTRGENKFL